MRTVVITGGTDGLGKGLALHYLRQGARVLAVGSTPAKGGALRRTHTGSINVGLVSFVAGSLALLGWVAYHFLFVVEQNKWLLPF